MESIDPFLFLLFLVALIISGILLISVAIILYQQRQIREQKKQIKRLKKTVQTSSPPDTRLAPVVQAASTLPAIGLESSESPNENMRPITANKSSAVEGLSSAIAVENPGLEITPEFSRALGLLNSDMPCIFITGKAGTGKSTLLTHFVETTNKSVALLAPTGMAALKINGQTVHSFFGFPPKVLTEEDIKPSRKRELYRALDTIVIDEISMVRTDLLDAIDQFLRLNGKDRQQPFGGIQMVFFGDLYQLPPVISDEDESKYLASNYDGSFFFDAHVLKQIRMEIIELTQVFRQKDPEFIGALNAIRTNTADKSVLDYINQRYAPTGSTDRNTFITLVTKNDSADWINRQELSKLQSHSYSYTAMLEGEFTKDKWKRRLPADLELTLKKNARVIFIKNDTQKRWLNGNRGRVIELGEDYIKVEVEQEDGRFVHEVSREAWELIKYKFDSSSFRLKSEVVGKFIQYPLRLGWAITIHKSQGATLDRVHIDFDGGAFAAGQAYVALSRCKSLEGITLEQPLALSDIRSDASVKRFMASALPQPDFPTEKLLDEVEESKRVKKDRAKRFVSDKIDEEHKYTYQRVGDPDWFVDETVNLVLPILYQNGHGIDLRKYRGEIKVYVDGKYRWTATVSDEMSAQALWKATRSLDYVSIQPISKFDAVRLSALANR